MPADHIDTVRKLVALSLFNDSPAERTSAHKKAVALIKKHDIGQGNLFSTTSAAAWSLEDGLRFADKVREVAKDPDVQKVASAGKELAMGVVSLFKKVKK